ncbi:MAG TPA: ANTAR domain-containing protein [Aliidongia sp.]|uniref:ANTAR domain-containing response regulator n=1 Tax=Aliidongia sp. TaxID=1914230 RepID=UPI002DDCC400|nr:ANTAR domain-containing protein [Aliidongia sp.]HEV2676508.1 ANTAR domain-containing protein [Aliidongia sp.]
MRVLLADANLDRAASVADCLAATGADEVLRLASGETLAQAVSRHRPDVIIVDMARPDRDQLDSIREVVSRHPSPIVLFVDRNDPAFMEAAIEAGVSSYNVVGTALPDVKPIVEAAVVMFRRYRQVETELRKAEASLKERAIIDRAKARIMQERRMSEPDAYRWLRRQAMDRGRRIADVAAELLSADAAPSKDRRGSHGDR